MLTQTGFDQNTEHVLLALAQSLSPRAEKKALVKTALEMQPFRSLIDAGKGWAPYRSFLNRSLPAWVKFRGAFGSFQEAEAHVPSGVPLGYDHEEIALGYKNQRFLSSDYPAVFWLEQAFRDGTRVFDFGGSVGISFYLWERYASYPDAIRWTVCDVPAVAAAGEKIARERQETRLRFTADFSDADGADLLLASGSLQYVEASLASMLAQLHVCPRHIVINRIPLHPERECVTIQNIRWMVCPYHVFKMNTFVGELLSLGYVLRDAWTVLDHSCWIPFYPEHSLESYSGLYFCRD